MTAVTLVALVALAVPTEDALALDADRSRPNTASERSGLLGWGLGLELPMVGVAGGLGSSSRPGVGYTVGAALSFEATPRLLVRLFVHGGRFYGGRAALSHDGAEGGDTREDAGLSAVDFGGGLAYQWLNASPVAIPYVGIDAGASFGGYSYLLSEQTKTSLGDPDVGRSDESDCDSSGRCTSEIYKAHGFGAMGGVRAGLRVPLRSWLASIIELSLYYLPISDTLVSNTLTRLNVRSYPESLWLARATFSVRLGL